MVLGVVLVVLGVVVEQVDAVANALQVDAVLKIPLPGPSKTAQNKQKTCKKIAKHSSGHSRCPRGGFGHAGLDSDLQNAQFSAQT